MTNAEAETIFIQFWDDFRARDLQHDQHDLVLLSIDLAEVLVAKGEHARAEELIGQCQPWRPGASTATPWPRGASQLNLVLRML